MTLAVLQVDDPSDERLADYRHLTDVNRRQTVEAAGGFFIAEGRLVIERLVQSRYPARSFLVSEAKLAVLTEVLGSRDVIAPVYVAAPSVMEGVAGFPVHRGLLASAGRLPLPDPASVIAGQRLCMVLEGINDHENMGALFRNAAAFGCGAVVLDPACCDPLYRRSVRVSIGHALSVPYTIARDWPNTLAVMRAAGFTVVALTPHADAAPLCSVTTDRPVALVLGAEGPGLSPAALAAADVCVRIPMAPGVDSLNVATAGAIALSHFNPFSLQ